MPTPIHNLSISPLTPTGASPGVAPERNDGASFTNMLRDQLAQVSQMQSEADDNLKKVLGGQSDSLTDVMVAARKAQVAFTLLMEIRNKLVDAYQELQNLRV